MCVEVRGQCQMISDCSLTFEHRASLWTQSSPNELGQQTNVLQGHSSLHCPSTSCPKHWGCRCVLLCLNFYICSWGFELGSLFLHRRYPHGPFILFFFFFFGLSFFVLRCDFPVAVQAALELVILQPQHPYVRISDEPHAQLKLTCIIVICTHFILHVLDQHKNTVLSVLRNIYILKHILSIVP